jgi:hypothetical protein
MDNIVLRASAAGYPGAGVAGRPGRLPADRHARGRIPAHRGDGGQGPESGILPSRGRHAILRIGHGVFATTYAKGTALSLDDRKNRPESDDDDDGHSKRNRRSDYVEEYDEDEDDGDSDLIDDDDIDYEEDDEDLEDDDDDDDDR